MSDESPSTQPDQTGAGNAPESGARSAGRPPADFTTLVLSVHESALQSMGVKGEEFEKDLEAAQYQIELLALCAQLTITSGLGLRHGSGEHDRRYRPERREQPASHAPARKCLPTEMALPIRPRSRPHATPSAAPWASKNAVSKFR